MLFDLAVSSGEPGYGSLPVSILQAEREGGDCALFVILSHHSGFEIRTHAMYAKRVAWGVQELRAASIENAKVWCRHMEAVLPGRCYTLVDPEFDQFKPVIERWIRVRTPYIHLSKNKYRKAAMQGCYPTV